MSVDVAISAFPWGAYLGEEGLAKGVDVCISSWARYAPNTVPTGAKAGGNYLSGYLIGREAQRNGYAEGIALGVDGRLSEGAGENLFIVKDGRILTPPAAASILVGITRDTVFKLCAAAGIEIVEQILPREMLYVADEVFFSGTAAEITPVRSIDGVETRSRRSRSDHQAAAGRFQRPLHRRDARSPRLARTRRRPPPRRTPKRRRGRPPMRANRRSPYSPQTVGAPPPADARPRSLFEKVWDAHVVEPETQDRPALIYIDLHLVHEVTSPQAFGELDARGLKVRRPDKTFATLDHSTPTLPAGPDGERPYVTEEAKTQVETLQANTARHGVELAGLGQRRSRRHPRHRAGTGADPAGHDGRLRRQPHLHPRRLRGARLRHRHD